MLERPKFYQQEFCVTSLRYSKQAGNLIQTRRIMDLIPQVPNSFRAARIMWETDEAASETVLLKSP